MELAGLLVDAGLGKSGHLGLLSFLMRMTITLLRRPHVGNAAGGAMTAVADFPEATINQGRPFSLPREGRGQGTALLLVRHAPRLFFFFRYNLHTIKMSINMQLNVS